MKIRGNAWALLAPGLVLGSIMVAVKLAETLSQASFAHLGVYPRKWTSLGGIVLSPIIHGSWTHLASNVLPLMLLTAGMWLLYPRLARRVLILSWLLPGMYVWIAARPSYHIGASGMVYALAFFLTFSGVFRRDTASAALSLAVISLYGGIVWGLLPLEPGVSWESHLYGAMVGVIMAFFFRKKDGIPRKTYDWQSEPDDPEATGPWDYKRWAPPGTAASANRPDAPDGG